jgi:hypothetical protein
VTALAEELAGGHDQLDEQYCVACCRPYRRLSQDGILLETICIEALLEDTTNDIIFGFTCQFLYNYYECAELFLQEFNGRIKKPLHERVIKDLQRAVKEYVRTKSNPLTTSKLDLAKSYLRLWYLV